MLGEINNPCSECVHSGAPSDHKQQTRQRRSVFAVPSHLLPHLHRHVNRSRRYAGPALCGRPGRSGQAHSAATAFKLEWPESDFQFLGAGNPPDPQKKPARHFEQEVRESKFCARKTVRPLMNNIPDERPPLFQNHFFFPEALYSHFQKRFHQISV